MQTKPRLSDAPFDVRVMNEQRVEIYELLVQELEPTGRSFMTLEKIASMVGKEFTEATFYSCLQAVRLREPNCKVGYFVGAMKNQVPGLVRKMRTVFVRPMKND